MCLARRWEISSIWAAKPQPQLIHVHTHIEGHGGDCDHVSVSVLSFLQYTFVNGLPSLLSNFCRSLSGVYGNDVCSLQVSFDYIFVSTTKTFSFG